MVLRRAWAPRSIMCTLGKRRREDGGRTKEGRKEEAQCSSQNKNPIAGGFGIKTSNINMNI